ncbi:MAG: hypothetical protein WC492_05015 [Candidatus Micrarchaeia archaeon]
MKTINLFAAVFLFAIIFTQVGFAASSALLQVESYNTTPSTVYAGTVGYLQIYLVNDGTATASSVTTYYSLDGASNSNYVGSIGAGSSAQTAVPFKIAPESAGGIQLVNVDIYYLTEGASAANSNSNKISIQIPITVAQQNPLVINTLSVSDQGISAGEKTSVEIELKNNGGLINNLQITTAGNSSFSLDGTTQIIVGTIPANESRKVNVSVVSSSSLSAGVYNIPLVFTYYNRLNAPTEVNLPVGPISIVGTSTQYRLEIESLKPVEIGSQANLRLVLKNTGTQTISATVDVNATDEFTPIGMQRVYFDDVKPGESMPKEIILGVSSSASPGYYSIPFELTPSVGSASTQYAGISVQATTGISVSMDTGSITKSVLIANTGNYQVHSVNVIARVNGTNTELAQSFIGTLNIDDFSTMTLSTTTLGNSRNNAIEIEVTYKDVMNQEHVVKQVLDTSSGQGYALNTTMGSTSANTGAVPGSRPSGSGGLFGILGGGPSSRNASGTSTSTQSGGLPILQIVGAVVLLVIVYFLYGRWKKKNTVKKEASK